MSQIDKDKLNAIRETCDLIETLESDDDLVLAHRALYDLAGKALSSFAISVVKSGGKLPPNKKDSQP